MSSEPHLKDCTERPPAKRRTYAVDYFADTDKRARNVVVTDGYTTFEDIRKILAVHEYSSNAWVHVERINVHGVRLLTEVKVER